MPNAQKSQVIPQGKAVAIRLPQNVKGQNKTGAGKPK